MKIERIPISQINPAPYNPRKDLKPGDREYEKLKRSIQKFDIVEPLVWNKRTGNLVGGHQRLKIIKNELGMTEAEVSVVDLDEKSEKALNVALNKISGDWDIRALKELLVDLDDGSFDLTLTGFDEKELKELIDFEGAGATNGEDEVPEPPKVARTKRGDLYVMGEHRLLCGDSTSTADVKRLTDRKMADAVFTSPPYNVGIKYASHDDEMESGDYLQMIEAVIANCFDAMNDGRLIAWNVGVSPKSRPFVHAVKLEDAGFSFFRQIVWKKTGCQIPLWQNSVRKPTARYYLPNYNHELIYLASKGPVEIGDPTNMPEELSMDVWDVSQFSAGGHDHPAAFPVKLARLGIDVMTAKGELVLEPFGGAGSTVIACEENGRRCFAMELDPIYCDVIVQRWEKFSGKKAVRSTIQEAVGA